MGPTARAADHGDGTTFGAIAGGSADITDVFAWMSGDASKINLVMDVAPAADTTTTFSDAIQYNFFLASYTDYLSSVMGTAATKKVHVTCTFDMTQVIQCWVVDNASGTVLDYVTGDASDPTTPLVSASGGMKVFAGLRNDPFFFNLGGFRFATNAIYQAVTGANPPQADANGCYDLGGTAQTLVSALTSGCTGPGSMGYNFFDKPAAGSNDSCPDTYLINQAFTGNILAITLQIDKSFVVDDTNPILAFWASTNM